MFGQGCGKFKIWVSRVNNKLNDKGLNKNRTKIPKNAQKTS